MQIKLNHLIVDQTECKLNQLLLRNHFDYLFIYFFKEKDKEKKKRKHVWRDEIVILLIEISLLSLILKYYVSSSHQHELGAILGWF